MAVPRQGLVMRNVDFPVHTMQFPSGLRVIAERDTRTPSVAVVLVVGVGSSNDPPGKEGLAHYVEHLAFRSRPDGVSSFAHQLDQAGAGEWNAFTSLDETVYLETGPKQSLDSLLQAEGLRMLSTVAHVSPETFGVELDVVRNELRQRAEMGLVGDVLGSMQETLFPPGHPYARPIGGTQTSLQMLTADDVTSFLGKHYRPDNMMLEIIGDFDPATIEKRVMLSLPRALLNKPANATPPPQRAQTASVPSVPPVPGPDTIVTKYAAVSTPELWIGWTLPSAFHGDKHQIEFTQMFITNALKEIDTAEADIASISTSLCKGRDASMFLIRLKLANENHLEARAQYVWNVLAQLNEAPEGAGRANAEETAFEVQKSRAMVETVLDAENMVSRAIQRATITQVTGDPNDYSRQLSDIAALEKTSFVDFVTKYVNRQRARVVLFRPRNNGEELPPAIGFGADTTEDENKQQVTADIQQLAQIAPGHHARSYSSFTLDNGLQVFLAERPGLPLVSAHLRFVAGVADAEDLGAAHAAIAASRTGGGFSGDPAEFGARFLRRFWDDSNNYSITGASGNVELMLAILAENTNIFTLSPQAWDTFRRNQIPFQEIIEHRPEAIAEQEFLETVFHGSVFGRVFTTALWKNTTPAKAEQWLTHTHVPNNAVLVIAGEFDHSVVEPIVREQFGSWKKSSKPFSPIPTLAPSDKPATEPKLIVTHRPGTTQAQIKFGCLLPPAHKPITDVQHDLGAALLENRLLTILRENGGVTYGLHASAHIHRGGTAYLTVEGAVEQSKLVYSLSALKNALENFRQSPANAQALARLKLRLARRDASRFMSNEAIAYAVTWRKAMGFLVSSLDDYAMFLGSVTAEDIQADFKACFSGNPTLVIVGDSTLAHAAFKNVWQTPISPPAN